MWENGRDREIGLVDAVGHKIEAPTMGFND